MAVHPIQIHLDHAEECKLKLFPGRGTWAVYRGEEGIERFLSISANDLEITVDQDPFPPQKERDHTTVRVNHPRIRVTVDKDEVSIDFDGDNATVTVYYDGGDYPFFDACLSRKRPSSGTISVSSPDGGETDYLLPGQNKRRVTLALTPSPEPCCD